MGAVAKFTKYLNKEGYKSTRQRKLITEYFLKLRRGHISAEELYFDLVKKYPFIGRVTIYRTLKLLTKAGLAVESQFGENHLHYEPTTSLHHDHLICTACGSIIEFKNSKIEKLQEELAKHHDFQVQNHRLELFGLCKKCRNSAGLSPDQSGGDCPQSV